MKNILLLTDFSENAKAAAETALTLSQKLHTNLLLLNTFVFYPVAENYVGGQWFPELYKEQEEENQERLYQLKLELEELSLTTLEPGDRRPVIATQVEDIGPHFGLADVLEKNRIELVVMGTHEEEAFGKNHVSNVIRSARLPVLVVPPGADLNKTTRAIYATDYDLQDIDAISWLAKIAKGLHEEINVVHVAGPE
ncbi:MAG: universal stress protein, partial [Bacteroidetes bacterium]|nr:universal stress protein [Bacteroidota bacterium]